MSEEQAILDEISEEVKHDQLVKFVKKHQSTITGVVSALVAGIVMYTSWTKRVKKELYDTTQALFQAIANDEHGRLVIDSMVANSPTKIVPIIEIIKAGLAVSNETKPEEKAKIQEMLLSISSRNGVEQEWRDLALLIYVSRATAGEDYNKLIEQLRPLTADDRPFHLSAKELIGVLYMAIGKRNEAIQMLDLVISNAAAPQSMRKRCEILKCNYRS